MNKAEEELKVIMDSLNNWRLNNNVGTVSMFIDISGVGISYARDRNDSSNWIAYVEGDYESFKVETPAERTAGESK